MRLEQLKKDDFDREKQKEKTTISIYIISAALRCRK